MPEDEAATGTRRPLRLSPELRAELLGIFIQEGRERLADAERILAGPFPASGTDAFSALYRHPHTLASTASYLDFTAVHTVCRELTDLLRGGMHGSTLAPGAETPTREAYARLREAFDAVAADHA